MINQPQDTTLYIIVGESYSNGCLCAGRVGDQNRMDSMNVEQTNHMHVQCICSKICGSRISRLSHTKLQDQIFNISLDELYQQIQGVKQIPSITKIILRGISGYAPKNIPNSYRVFRKLKFSFSNISSGSMTVYHDDIGPYPP